MDDVQNDDSTIDAAAASTDCDTKESIIDLELKKDIEKEAENWLWWQEFGIWFIGTIVAFIILCVLMFSGGLVKYYPIDNFGFVRAHELNMKNFETELHKGKTIAIAMFTDTCTNCDRVRTIWNGLMKAHADNPDVLVNFVDCDRRVSSQLCMHLGVSMAPTILYGDPFSLEIYRANYSEVDEENLTSFVGNMTALCGPLRRDACNETQLQLLDKYERMPEQGRDVEMMKRDRQVQKANAQLQNVTMEMHQELVEKLFEKDVTIRKYKQESGLSWLEMIHNTSQAGEPPEEETTEVAEKTEEEKEAEKSYEVRASLLLKDIIGLQNDEIGTTPM